MSPVPDAVLFPPLPPSTFGDCSTFSLEEDDFDEGEYFEDDRGKAYLAPSTILCPAPRRPASNEINVWLEAMEGRIELDDLTPKSPDTHG